ncbi:MAG TPA: thioredoxin domain-containing protein [Acidothermaceae bacterium]|nr:thioredoxin domain-containing protein [Acidothermaceae bacterium]
MTNRLAGETSPYLLQHKDNPVDWWPWSPAAFDDARTRGIPVLLSVGYAACHWCHVMAHESFEDALTAAQMNEHFVCIKVDREERPDVDAIYMDATQALTGHGGWPMTCFLTPEGQPFYCGTYYPNRPLQGMPSFRQVLEAVSQAWLDRRDELTSAGADVVRLLGERAAVPTEQTPPDADILEAAVASLRSDFDPAHGGFGGAPKFPPSAVLEFLLRHRSLGALEMVAVTCTAMARGGMYDQLAGGFARYSVDNAWVVPHFEKMLYDNAQLVRIYAHWWRATGSPLARRIAIETAQFMIDDLRTPEGGFASALDADTNGVEGSTYVWTRGQLLDLLGVDDAQWAADLLVVSAAGTFEHGSSVLQLPAEPDGEWRWSRIRAALLDARRGRPQPGRDDKVVAAWNGLAIAALAEAGVLFDRDDFVDAAVDVARLLIDVHLVDGRLRRVSRDGVAGQPVGVLEDYADVAEGLLVLAQVTGSRELLEQAGVLLDACLSHFVDGAGGFFDTADDAEALVRRPQNLTDDATPAGQSALAQALLTYAALTGSTSHRAAAEAALGATRVLGARYPRAAGWGLAAAAALLAGPAEIAIVGAGAGVATGAMARTVGVMTDLERAAWMSTSPGAVIAVAQSNGEPAWAPLLEGRGAIDGLPTAYVCRQFVCLRPVTAVGDLAVAVKG